MRHNKLLDAKRCILMVVDIQDAFLPHIHEMDRVIERSVVLIQAARHLEIPIIVTEQYPKGLGRTVQPIQEALEGTPYYDKITFSCCQDETIQQQLLDLDREQVLIVGIEAHVCIAQTAFDALALGINPFIAVDAVSSRKLSDAEIAIDRMRNEGIVITSTEAAIMEMTFSSKHPHFKALTKLIK